MTFAQVRYQIRSDGRCVYPEGVAGVRWIAVVYSATENVMLGETDEEVEGREPDVVILDEEQAARGMDELISRYPEQDSESKPPVARKTSRRQREARASRRSG